MEIRWSLRRDLPGMLDVDDGGWSQERFERCLARRNTICMVAVDGDVVRGFIIYELYRHRYNIVRLCGTGRIVRALLDKLAKNRRDCIYMSLPDDNLPGHICLRDNGFRCVNIVGDNYLFRRDYNEVTSDTRIGSR